MITNESDGGWFNLKGKIKGCLQETNSIRFFDGNFSSPPSIFQREGVRGWVKMRLKLAQSIFT